MLLLLFVSPNGNVLGGARLLNSLLLAVNCSLLVAVIPLHAAKCIGCDLCSSIQEWSTQRVATTVWIGKARSMALSCAYDARMDA